LIGFTNKKIKTRKEIAAEYGTTVKTMKRRLLKKGMVLQSGSLFPNDYKKIYIALGFPSKLQSGDEVTLKRPM
jgi:hypothetical protein